MTMLEITTLAIALWGAALSTYLAVNALLRERRVRRVQIRSAAGKLLQGVEQTVDGPPRLRAEFVTAPSWCDSDIVHLEQLAAQDGGAVLKLVGMIAPDLRWMHAELERVDFGLLGNDFPWPEFQRRRRDARDRLMVLETVSGGPARGWISPHTVRRTIEGKTPLG